MQFRLNVTTLFHDDYMEFIASSPELFDFISSYNDTDFWRVVPWSSCSCLWEQNRVAAWEFCCFAWDVAVYWEVCLDREVDEAERELLAAELQAQDDLLNRAWEW